MVMLNDVDRRDGSGLPGGEDRRANPHIRAIFDTACKLTAPFFDPEQGWGGQSLTMYARQALREAFPDLTQQDTALLFAAVQRFHRSSQSK